MMMTPTSNAMAPKIMRPYLVTSKLPMRSLIDASWNCVAVCAVTGSSLSNFCTPETFLTIALLTAVASDPGLTCTNQVLPSPSSDLPGPPT